MKKIFTKISLFAKSKKILAILLALCMSEVGYAQWSFNAYAPDYRTTSYGVTYLCYGVSQGVATGGLALYNMKQVKNVAELNSYAFVSNKSEITINPKLVSNTYAVVKLDPGLFIGAYNKGLRTIVLPEPTTVEYFDGSGTIYVAPSIKDNGDGTPESDFNNTFDPELEIKFGLEINNYTLTTAQRNAYIAAGFPETVLPPDPSASVTSGDFGAQTNNLHWSFANNTLTITGFGEMNNFTNAGAPWYHLRANITSISLPDGLTSIGAYAFEGCSAITSISLPEGITSLPNGAFVNCTSLKTISILYAEDVIQLPGTGSMATMNVFNGANSNVKMTAVVPSNLMADYADSDWNNRFNFAPASAYGTCGENLVWLYSNHTITIGGSGAMDNYTAGTAPWADLRLYINSVIINDGVTSIGDYAFYYTDAPGATNENYVSSITINGNSLQSIGSHAFRQAAFSSISLPNSLTSIGDYAFISCKSLTSISIPSHVTVIPQNAFEGCTALQSVTISGLITSIGAYAFNGCTSLNTFAYVSSVLNTIGNNAFAGAAFSAFTIPSSVTTMGENIFFACNGGSNGLTVELPWTAEIPAGINVHAFDQNPGGGYAAITLRIPDEGDICAYADKFGTTKKVYKNSTNDNLVCQTCGTDLYWSLDEGVLTISGTGTTMTNFAYGATPWEGQKSSITSVVVEAQNLTNIGQYAFYGCSNLTSVTLGNAVTTIGSSAFSSSMNALAEPIYNSHLFVKMPNSWLATHEGTFAIPEGTETIAASAFESCTNLKSVTIPNTVTTIGDNVFYGCNNADFNSVVIPNSVLSIGTSVFRYCSNLTSVELSSGMTTIPRNMFTGCSKLESVTIPNTITSIADAFSSCTSLKTLVIPASVNSISAGAFSSCTNLATVYMKGASAPTLEVTQYSSTFKNCGDITMFIPKGSRDSYVAAYGEETYGANSLTIKEEGVFTDDDATITETMEGLIGETLEEVTTVRPVQQNNQYNTLCLPFSMDETQIAESSLVGAEIYKFSNAEKDGEYLNLHFQPVTAIEAGIPYFIRYPQEGDNLTGLDFANVTFETATAGSVTHGDVTLIGTLSQVTINGSGKLYLAANNNLKWYDGDKTIYPFRAYFSVAGVGPNNAPKARIVQRESTTTDIESIQYSVISSQKIIENGQLFIIKNGVKYNAQGQIVK